MRPAPRTGADGLLPVHVLPVSANASAVSRTVPSRRAFSPCWRRVSLLWLLFLGLPVFVAADDFDPKENPWGFGYDGGLTLRRKLGDKWEVGISGGPNDYLSSSSEERIRESDPPSSNSTTQTDQDTRREGGFVAPHFGRTVWQRGDFDLLCSLSPRFEWANRSDGSSSQSATSAAHDWSHRDQDDRNWSLSLEFRPGYRPVSWFSIEVAFGLRYAWTKSTLRDEIIYFRDDGATDRYVTNRESHGQSFSLVGYSGISSLQFIVWF